MSKTPEHDKLQSIAIASQCIGEFLEWARSQGLYFCRIQRLNRSGDEGYVPDGMGVEERLAEYFDIDLDVIEKEKRAILDEIRRRHKQAKPLDRPRIL